jgi:hypothetical protein
LKLTEVAVSHEYQASISRAFDAPSQWRKDKGKSINMGNLATENIQPSTHL